GQHQAKHRLDDGHRARQDTGVMTTATLDRRARAIDGDGLLLFENRRRRLESKPQQDWLTVRNPALDAARIITTRGDPSALVRVVGIVVLRANHHGSRKA